MRSPNFTLPNLTANAISPMPVLHMNPVLLPFYRDAFALRAILAFALAYV